MKKSIYIITIGTSVLLTSCGGGQSSGKNNKSDNKEIAKTQPTVTHVTEDKNVIKWFDLNSGNQASYISNNLEGTWNKNISLTYMFEDLKKDVKLNKNPSSDKLSFDIAPPINFVKEYNTKKGIKSVAGKYSVSNNLINFVSDKESYSESVLFISENILITESKTSELGIDFLDFSIYQKANTKEFKSELKEFLKEFFATSYIEFADKSKIGDMSSLLTTFRKLEFISLLDKSVFDIKKDSLIIIVRDNSKRGFNELIAKNAKEYQDIKAIKDFDISKDLESKIPILSEMWRIADALGLEKKEITSLYNKINTELTEYALYGSGKDYELESAAKSFIPQTLKDPDSFEFVAGQLMGKNKNGLVYKVQYRGKNSFGAKVVNVSTLVLAFDKNQGLYTVVDMK